MLVMIPVVGEFVIPEMLGGPDTLMIGRMLWQEFFNNRDWPVASAVSIVMLLLLIIPIMIFHRAQAREMESETRMSQNDAQLAFQPDCSWRSGFCSLYLPMLSLIVYSFNESKLVTVWAGFSTKWYFELLRTSK